MRLIEADQRPPAGADPRNFVLPATFQRLVGPDDALPVRLYRVRFDEGARTYWHRHDDVQLLVGLSGACAVVNRDGRELTLRAGDVVVVEAGEEHWHGAADGTPGEHLAINVGEKTTWLESSGASE